MVFTKCNCFSSSWTKRNNSANIAEVFNSSPRTCYCRKKKIPPRLFSKPKTCVLERDHLKPLVPILDPEKFMNSDYFNQSEAESIIGGLGKVTSKYLQNTRTSSEEFAVDGTAEKRESASSDIEAKQSTKDSTKPSGAKTVDGTKSELSSLNDFRKAHYFETHSTEDLLKTVPEHTCVHKFTLDERSLAKPLNTDVFGLSRCIICNKPMLNPAIAHKTDDRAVAKSAGTVQKFYKYGLVPKRIYMADSGNVRVELALKDFRECKTKRPNYFNTYALRYQRGVK